MSKFVTHDVLDCLQVICDCGDFDHSFIFSYDPTEEYPDMILSVHLNPHRPWYRRVVRAITYVLGVRSKYGDFDEILIGKQEKLDDLFEFLAAVMIARKEKERAEAFSFLTTFNLKVIPEEENGN